MVALCATLVNRFYEKHKIQNVSKNETRTINILRFAFHILYYSPLPSFIFFLKNIIREQSAAIDPTIGIVGGITNPMIIQATAILKGFFNMAKIMRNILPPRAL